MRRGTHRGVELIDSRTSEEKSLSIHPSIATVNSGGVRVVRGVGGTTAEELEKDSVSTCGVTLKLKCGGSDGDLHA